MPDFAIELVGICKCFGAVQANQDVTLAVAKASIHGIIGENGAGKSTLMNILYGYYQADSGSIKVNGQVAYIRNSQEAIKYGIGMVHQHFMLVETFTVLENIVLGAEDTIRLNTSLSRARAHLEELNKKYSLAIDPDSQVSNLEVSLQQRVEILKALYRGANVFILDEPTAVLTPQETEHLFQILRELKRQGKTVILITHKLHEVMAITDVVTVMRAGSVVGQVQTSRANKAQLAALMVGRQVSLTIDRKSSSPGAEVLRVQDVTWVDKRGVKKLDKVSFQVRAGEIVGVAGVAGSGQTELLALLAGLLEPTAGHIFYKDNDLSKLSHGVAKAALLRRLGIAHVPEDRIRDGLIEPFALFENTILGYHGEKRICPRLFFSRRALLDRAAAFIKAFDVRPADPRIRASLLSGGNQQKIVLAREIDADPTLLLVGQPTRGVDIGAIEFIHKRLVELRDKGKAILLVSVELEEILALSDRVLVMAGGHITGDVLARDVTMTSLGLLMGGARH